MLDELSALGSFAPISLAELEATAGLLSRVDRKYILSVPQAQALMTALAPTHCVLEIGGRRAFAYRSVYLDSPCLGAFRAHMQERRRRYKCRTRHYVDSDRHVFEVKLKGLRGMTVKHQMPLAAPEPTAEALAFAAARVGEAYGRTPRDLRPSISTTYVRVTLAVGDHRVTVDHGLSFAADTGGTAALRDEYVIVESKSPQGAGTADGVLKRLGIRPVECSKYCVGVALLRDDVRANRLRWLLHRYFTPATMAVHA